MALLAAGLAVAPTAFAQSAPASSTLTETVVTASRIQTRADDLVSDVRVIDRRVIEASTARSLPELLAREAGLQMSANGGLGQNTSVFIRGTNGRHALLLVDGVRIGSATAGTAPWEAVPLNLVERIEVLQGPASALYGADAAGGVVQVFTRQGREGLHPHAAVTAGTYGHGQVAAGLQGGQGDLRYALGVQRLKERGISATNSLQTYDYDADRDGFRQDTANASVRYALPRGWEIDAALMYADGVSRFDDGAGVNTRSAVRSVTPQAGLQGRVAPGWRTEIRVSRNEDVNHPIASSYGSDPVTTRQTHWNWQNTVDSPWGVVLAGLERRDQDVVSTTSYAVKERRVDSAFVGLNGQSGPSSWQFNARRDVNSQFGDSNTGLAGYGLRLSPQWRVSASWGTTFVAPSFNDLYYPGYANPALRPEHGVSREMALAWSQGASQAKLVRFDNRIRDMIVSSAPSYIPQNVGRARLQGWSLTGQSKVGGLALRASLDALDPRNTLDGKQLVRRARQQASLAADWQQAQWTWGASLLHVGSRYDNATNTRQLAAFTTLDLRAQWQFSRDASLQLKVNNAGDTRYETAYGYNQPGRAAYLTLRWEPR